MAFTLEQNPAGTEAEPVEPATDQTEFSVSAAPVIENGEAAGAALGEEELPASYGRRTLCLMPRDPRTLFAYWDVDWKQAFADHPPRDRKVHLRVRNAAGTEISQAVEPMAGSSYITVPDADASYVGELGYYEPPADWQSVATSETIATPPDASTMAEPGFATVPFHLSFQRMIDMFRVSKHENASLTAMLQDLRERASSAAAAATFTPQEREIAHALDTAANNEAPRPPASTQKLPDLWVRRTAERILGFGGSSPRDGFGGSSWRR